MFYQTLITGELPAMAHKPNHPDTSSLLSKISEVLFPNGEDHLQLNEEQIVALFDLGITAGTPVGWIDIVDEILDLDEPLNAMHQELNLCSNKELDEKLDSAEQLLAKATALLENAEANIKREWQNESLYFFRQAYNRLKSRIFVLRSLG